MQLVGQQLGVVAEGAGGGVVHRVREDDHERVGLARRLVLDEHGVRGAVGEQLLPVVDEPGGVDDLDESMWSIGELDRVRIDTAHDESVVPVAEIIEFTTVGSLRVQPGHLPGGGDRCIVIVAENDDHHGQRRRNAEADEDREGGARTGAGTLRGQRWFLLVETDSVCGGVGVTDGHRTHAATT